MSFRKDILAACTVGDLAWLQRSIARVSINLSAIQNKEGQNALHLAAMHGKFECVNYLLDHCAIDVNEPSGDSRSTALHYCVSKSSSGPSSLQCLKKLLERGAKHSIKDADSQTVLHYAAKSGNVKCVKLLLEHGADIDALDAGGNTPHDLASLYGHHECTRLLRALHWACRKDSTAREKIEAQVLNRRRERESSTLRTRLQREAAEDSYSLWMRNKNLPSSADHHKSDSRYKETRTQSCGACSALTRQRFGPHSSNTLAKPIKISHHQEERNVQGVGNPEKLFPYSNYPPRSAVAQRKKHCRSQSATPNSRTIKRISHPHSAPPLRTVSTGTAATTTSTLDPCPEVDEVSSRDRQMDEQGDGSYDDDDDALFHEVGQMGEFRSSALPRFINGKQLTQLLKMISSSTIPGTKSTDSLPLSQNRASTRHARYRSQFHRRFSLGAIPEGQVVVDYIKNGAVTMDLTAWDSQDDVQESNGEGAVDLGEGLDSSVDNPKESVMPFAAVPEESGCRPITPPDKPPQLSLAIVNFKWDKERNAVCTEAVSSPLVPHPLLEQQLRNSSRKPLSRPSTAAASSQAVSRRMTVPPKSAPPNTVRTAPNSLLLLGGLASKSMVISDEGTGVRPRDTAPNAQCIKPATFAFGGNLVHT